MQVDFYSKVDSSQEMLCFQLAPQKGVYRAKQWSKLSGHLLSIEIQHIAKQSAFDFWFNNKYSAIVLSVSSPSFLDAKS